MGDSNIFKYCRLSGLRIRISGNNTRGGNLTVRGEIVNGKILNRTTVNLTKQTHTVTEILLRNRTIPVVVTLDLPSVVVEVGDGVAVAVKCSLKGIEPALNGLLSFFNGLSFIHFLIVPIANRMENEGFVVFALLVTKVNVGKKLHGLAIERVLNNRCTFIHTCGSVYLACTIFFRHTANDSAEGGKLVSVGDGQLGLACIIPSIVKLTLPSVHGIRNQSNLGEGGHGNGDLARYGVIVELVMCVKLGRGRNQRHSVGSTIFHVVEGVVTHIHTGGHHLTKVDDNRLGVICGNALYVHIKRAQNLISTNVYVGFALFLFGYGKTKLAVSGGNLSALKNGGGIALTAYGGGGLYGAVFNGDLDHHVHILHIREGGVYVIIVTEYVVLVIKLRCNKVNGETVANGEILVLVARILVHMECNCKNDLANGVRSALLTCRKQHATRMLVGVDNVGEKAHAGLALKGGHRLGNGVDVIHINHVGKLGECALGLDAQAPLECQISYIRNLNVLYLGIIRLPIIVSKNRHTLCVLPLGGIC